MESLKNITPSHKFYLQKKTHALKKHTVAYLCTGNDTDSYILYMDRLTNVLNIESHLLSDSSQALDGGCIYYLFYIFIHTVASKHFLFLWTRKDIRSASTDI